MKWIDSEITHIGTTKDLCHRCQEEKPTDFIVWYAPNSQTKSIVIFYCKDCCEYLVKRRYPEGLPQEPMRGE